MNGENYKGCLIIMIIIVIISFFQSCGDSGCSRKLSKLEQTEIEKKQWQSKYQTSETEKQHLAAQVALSNDTININKELIEKQSKRYSLAESKIEDLDGVVAHKDRDILKMENMLNRQIVKIILYFIPLLIITLYTLKNDLYKIKILFYKSFDFFKRKQFSIKQWGISLVGLIFIFICLPIILLQFFFVIELIFAMFAFSYIVLFITLVLFLLKSFYLGGKNDK